MGDEVSQKPAATVAARLPVLEAQPCGLACKIPGHDDVLQAADCAIVQNRLGALPRGQLRKVEIDNGGPSAFARRFENRARAYEIGGEWLLEKDWLS